MKYTQGVTSKTTKDQLEQDRFAGFIVLIIVIAVILTGLH